MPPVTAKGPIIDAYFVPVPANAGAKAAAPNAQRATFAGAARGPQVGEGAGDMAKIGPNIERYSKVIAWARAQKEKWNMVGETTAFATSIALGITAGTTIVGGIALKAGLTVAAAPLIVPLLVVPVIAVASLVAATWYARNRIETADMVEKYTLKKAQGEGINTTHLSAGADIRRADMAAAARQGSARIKSMLYAVQDKLQFLYDSYRDRLDEIDRNAAPLKQIRMQKKYNKKAAKERESMDADKEDQGNRFFRYVTIIGVSAIALGVAWHIGTIALGMSSTFSSIVSTMANYTFIVNSATVAGVLGLAGACIVAGVSRMVEAFQMRVTSDVKAKK